MVALGGACVVAPGGVCGCSGGCKVALGGHGYSGGCAWLLPGGACVVAPRGCAWLLWGACVVAPGGAWLLQGTCVIAARGHAWLLLGGHVWLLRGGAWDTTRYRDTINEWAVRILLECILVERSNYISKKYSLFVNTCIVTNKMNICCCKWCRVFKGPVFHTF